MSAIIAFSISLLSTAAYVMKLDSLAFKSMIFSASVLSVLGSDWVCLFLATMQTLILKSAIYITLKVL